MFQKKYYLYLSQSDFRVLLQSLASHNQVDIDELCDTVCEMDAGVLTVVR